MTNPLSTWDKDHTRRALLARIHTIMTRTTRHLHNQILIIRPQDRMRRLAHRVDAVRMERGGGRVEVLCDGDGEREAGSAAVVQAVDVFAGCDLGEVALDESFEPRDGRVLLGADVQAEGHGAGDSTLR